MSKERVSHYHIKNTSDGFIYSYETLQSAKNFVEEQCGIKGIYSREGLRIEAMCWKSKKIKHPMTLKYTLTFENRVWVKVDNKCNAEKFIESIK